MKWNNREMTTRELVDLALQPHPGPVYDPPYDSPLEDAFAWELVKVLDEKVRLHKQFEVSTMCGMFRIDFVAEIGSKKVGFECDGRDFHEVGRDEFRDAIILGSRGVDVIYHLPGAAITYHLRDCLWLASLCDPSIFDERARGPLDTWATDDARRSLWRVKEGMENLSLTYRGDRGLSTCWIFRRCAAVPADAPPHFWVGIWHFAKRIGATSIDELVLAWREHGLRGTLNSIVDESRSARMNLGRNPTEDEMSELLASVDDEAGHHVLWVAKNGDVYITQLPEHVSPGEWASRKADVQFRFETYVRGNGYVGREASVDSQHVRRTLSALRRGWEQGVVEYVDLV